MRASLAHSLVSKGYKKIYALRYTPIVHPWHRKAIKQCGNIINGRYERNELIILFTAIG